MHSFMFHIGDYLKDTAHLTIEEHGAYVKLLILYYTHGVALPNDMPAICRKVSARTPKERATVERILQEYFTKSDDGLTWFQKRCDVELRAFEKKSEVARNSAKQRWDNVERETDANAMRMQCERNANASVLHDVGNANRKPLTNNQEPITSNQEPLTNKDSKEETSRTLTKRRKKAADDFAECNAVTLFEPSKKTVEQEVWAAYSDEYERKYGVPPIRNMRVNSQIKQFCQRVPRVSAPMIAMFYVRTTQQFYNLKKHPIGLLLQDAETLATDWQTGTNRTSHTAREEDRMDSERAGWDKVIEMNRRGEL